MVLANTDQCDRTCPSEARGYDDGYTPGGVPFVRVDGGGGFVVAMIDEYSARS